MGHARAKSDVFPNRAKAVMLPTPLPQRAVKCQLFIASFTLPPSLPNLEPPL
jgi:hypothetical protein